MLCCGCGCAAQESPRTCAELGWDPHAQGLDPNVCGESNFIGADGADAAGRPHDHLESWRRCPKIPAAILHLRPVQNIPQICQNMPKVWPNLSKFQSQFRVRTGCVTFVDFPSALKTCVNAGGRLCTAAELLEDAGHGTVSRHDHC